jgi:hypothetical protein
VNIFHAIKDSLLIYFNGCIIFLHGYSIIYLFILHPFPSLISINILAIWMRNGGCQFLVNEGRARTYPENIKVTSSWLWRRHRPKKISFSKVCPPGSEALSVVFQEGRWPERYHLSLSHLTQVFLPPAPFLAGALNRATWLFSSWKNKFTIKIRLRYEFSNVPEINLPGPGWRSFCRWTYHSPTKGWRCVLNKKWRGGGRMEGKRKEGPDHFNGISNLNDNLSL